MVVVTRRRPHWRSSAVSTSVSRSCPDRSKSRTCTSGCVTTTTSRSLALATSETSRSPAPSGPLERSSLRLDRDADGRVWAARDPLVVNQPAQVRQSVKVPPVRDGLADDPLNADLAQRRPHADRVVSVRQRPHRGIALDEDMIVARVVDQPIPPAVELADHLQPDLQRLSIEPDLGGLGQLRLQGLHLSAPLIELLNVDVHATSGLTGQIR